MSSGVVTSGSPPVFRHDRGAAIEVRGLTRVFRDRTGEPVRANDGLDFRVPAGHVFGLLGPNGAGKTTLVMQLLGLVRPSEGAIVVNGADVVADPDAAKDFTGFLPQTPLAMDLIEVRRALHFTARLRGRDQRSARAQTDALLDELGLGEVAGRYVHQLSGGMRRLVNIGMALMGTPAVLILDEPTNELDPVNRRLVWNLVQRQSSEHGTTVVLVTHNVLEAEQAVHQVAVMREGRIIADGTPGQLKERLGLRPRLELSVRGGDDLRPAELSRLAAVGAAEPEGQAGRYVIDAAPERMPALVAVITGELGLDRIDDFRVARPTLEEVYLGLSAAPVPEAAQASSDPAARQDPHVPGEPPVPEPSASEPVPGAAPVPRPDRAGKLRRIAVSLKYLWLEQILQARTSWLWTVIVGVLMPMAMVFGLPRIGGGGTDRESLAVIASGAAVFSLTTQSFVALAMMIGIMKADGRMLYYASMPISKLAFISAIVLSRLLLVFPGLLAPLLAANLFYDAGLTLSPVLLLVFPLAALSLAALGMAIGSLIERVETIGVVTNLVVFVLLLASPVLITADSLPAPVRVLGYVLPPSYAADAVRRSLGGDLGLTFLGDLGALTLATVIGFLIASRWIRWRVK